MMCTAPPFPVVPMPSSAAPTAGLHFEQATLDELEGMGVERAEVTLHGQRVRVLVPEVGGAVMDEVDRGAVDEVADGAGLAGHRLKLLLIRVTVGGAALHSAWMASPTAFTTLSSCAGEAMKGGAIWIVSPP